MNEKILNLIRKKGILLEKDIFDIVGNYQDIDLVEGLLENLEKVSGQKIITRSSLKKNYEFVQKAVKELPGELKESVEKIFIRLGVSLEIKKESEVKEKEAKDKKEESSKERNKEGNVLFEGKIILSVNKEELKNITKEWKRKNLPEEVKIPIFNLILRKCTPKAVQLQDEVNLPFHVPMPRVGRRQQ